jgi:2-iminobutanoate/2-iminopropanoate deaminase
MDITSVNTEEAPMAVGPYSQGIIAGNLVFTAGEIPVNPADGSVPDNIEDQTRQAIENVFTVLRAAGVEKNGIVSVTVYLKDIEDFPKVNRIYAECFEEPFPARACIAAAALPKDVGIMISAIGVKN